MSFLWLFVSNEAKDFVTINIVFTLVDDGITYFSDQYNQSGRSIIVGRVGVDQKDHMHNWNKEVL